MTISRRRKILLVVTGVFVVIGIVAAQQWRRPASIDWFFTRIALDAALDSPELLTQTRALPAFLDWYNDDLDDASVAAGDKQFRQLHRDYKILLSYDDASLSRGQKLSKKILRWNLERQLEGEKYRYHNYPVNQLFGLQNQVPSFFDSFHSITDEEDANDYIVRLGKIAVKFDQAMEGLLIREQKGIIPPTFVIDKVIAEMKGFVGQPAENNLLYTSFAGKLETAGGIAADKRPQLLARAAAAINTSVYPAYHAYIDYFTDLRKKSTDDAGVWKFPDGERFYQSKLRQYTNTGLSADEIHRIGLREVARIEGEMTTILAAQGFDATQGFSAMIEKMAADPRFYYPDTDAGREQILGDYRAILKESNAAMGAAFLHRPKAALEVRRVPVFKEKTSPGAYYNQPALDGSRPGIFYANLYDIRATPRYGMRTLAYHEGIPGHHFQIATMSELKDLPIFRRVIGFTAYIEGWGLYAERLASEMGLEEDPFDNVGRLQGELFRAVRLVVDTGIHQKRWTREQAIDYMRANTGAALSDVTAEIERYIVLPGQATAYKMGMMEILRLREKAKKALGDSFDIRRFHDAVLGNGSVPLPVLEELVDDYIGKAESR